MKVEGVVDVLWGPGSGGRHRTRMKLMRSHGKVRVLMLTEKK
jgi:hypothetical protein